MRRARFMGLLALAIFMAGCFEIPHFKESVLSKKDKIIPVPLGSFEAQDGDTLELREKDGAVHVLISGGEDDTETRLKAFRAYHEDFWEFECTEKISGETMYILFAASVTKDRIVLKTMDTEKARELFSIDDAGAITDDIKKARAIIKKNRKTLFVEQWTLTRVK